MDNNNWKQKIQLSEFPSDNSKTFKITSFSKKYLLKCLKENHKLLHCIILLCAYLEAAF